MVNEIIKSYMTSLRCNELLSFVSLEYNVYAMSLDLRFSHDLSCGSTYLGSIKRDSTTWYLQR
jgi:hypothetical protein